MREDNSVFLKSIARLRENIAPETFHSICREYEPLDKLHDRARQAELYNKLKEVVDHSLITKGL